MSVVATAKPPQAPVAPGAIRVMVVDDAAVARGAIRQWLESEPDLALVASVHSGREAVAQVERHKPDVIVLDVEMPDLDGIAALPILLEKCPQAAVIMASALTRRNAEVTLKALSLGALDYIPKPDALGGITAQAYRHELIAKIRALGQRARKVAQRAREQAPWTDQDTGEIVRPAAPAPQVVPQDVPFVESPLLVPGASRPISLRPFSKIPPRVLVIGSSTGGPQALTSLTAALGAVIDRAPVLITQHMPPTFTTILAEQLARSTGRAVREGQDGEPVRAGQVYVAPGGRHMKVARRDGEAVIVLDDSAPINFCKPAVDVLFASAAEAWGAWVLGVILTGMGSDGTRGAADIVAAGGAVIAQDEATAVIWGMPGSAAEAGVCAAVLPLPAIAAKVNQLFGGDRA